ncbi:matrixin family metalloprotease [Patescibacteria group bacterium]|nr:matrixin family metalloprotease [Patescibacteria group bacterium]
MHKKLLIILIVSMFIAAGVAWLTNQPQTVLAKSQKAKFQLPANAVQVADNVYSLGTAFDKKSGKQVEGYAFIHRKDEAAKSGNAKLTATACYGFLAKDAKWKGAPESWVVNPANARGLDPTFVFGNLTGDIAKWETVADYNILGDGAPTDIPLIADTSAPDNQNEVYFADLSDPNTIAVTIVWGIFGGPTFNRQLVEWDQIYDDATYDWSMSGEAGKMDFENIATHELGHSVGMGDLYNSNCSNETMYGYAAYGETIKRDLNAGDVIGVNKLY